MYRIICKSKIHRAHVTQAELHYEGSITIDEVLLKAVDILPGEKVEVLNLKNGSRHETYAIAGKKHSGVICLNGPLAHTGVVGDEIIILAYAMVEESKVKKVVLKKVYVDKKNRIIKKLK